MERRRAGGHRAALVAASESMQNPHSPWGAGSDQVPCPAMQNAQEEQEEREEREEQEEQEEREEQEEQEEREEQELPKPETAA